MADWQKLISRGNVEDRRSAGPMLGGVGLVGAIIVVAFSYFTNGGDLGKALQQLEGTAITQQNFQSEDLAKSDQYAEFAATVLGSNNDYWQQVFTANERTYAAPKLVLFRGLTQSGCGGASSQYGPHYCPIDSTIYLDETFFDELQARFKAKGGDVAEAYVIAHEVGHHVQNLLGSLEESQESQEKAINAELQADCYAGLWANSIADKGVFESNEVTEALDAAAAVGDDRIQQKTTGRINPESWTHGSSDQRVNAFNAGYTTGDPTKCSYN